MFPFTICQNSSHPAKKLELRKRFRNCTPCPMLCLFCIIGTSWLNGRMLISTTAKGLASTGPASHQSHLSLQQWLYETPTSGVHTLWLWPKQITSSTDNRAKWSKGHASLQVAPHNATICSGRSLCWPWVNETSQILFLLKTSLHFCDKAWCSSTWSLQQDACQKRQN